MTSMVIYLRFPYLQKNVFPNQKEILRLSPPAFSLTKLENDESYKELKKAFEKIGDSYLSSIQVDARIPLLRQNEFKMDMSTVNSSLSVDLAKIADNIPENDAIPEDIIRQAEPVMQQCANSLANMIDRYNQELRSYLSLKELENTGYDRYLYLNEKTAATCKFCASRHGQVYSMLDLAGRKHIIPPVHSNCKCSLIAMDRNAEERYNADKQEFLDKIEEEIYNSFGGIYRLDPDSGLVPVPTIFPTNPITTNDNSDSRWYENLRDWAFNFGEDAKAAWDAFFANAATRGLNWNKDVPSFIDCLFSGIPSGLFNSFTERYERMIQDASIFTVANWALFGIPDMVNGAINPDEPFSFDHWMNSLGVATLLVGGYKMAKGAIKPASVPKLEGRLNSTFTGRLRGKNVTLENVRVREISYIKREPLERIALRKEFNKSIRSDFLKALSEDTEYIKGAGFSDANILKLQEGNVVRGWEVHHKLSLDDGGTNSFNNLVLIQNEPYHKVLTNYQNSFARQLKSGEGIRIQWPQPNGNIYPAQHK